MASSAVLMNAAVAQDRPLQRNTTTTSTEQITIPQRFEDALYNRGGTFYGNQRVPRSVTWFLGPFPENDISSDADDVHDLYVEVMTQQVFSDPIVRTADLTNPFDTSLLLLPTQAPPQTPSTSGYYTPPLPQAPTAQPQRAPGPVRALY
ncbi:MAG TPA: hypothetical protein V6C78_28370 [Crinalium sp.]